MRQILSLLLIPLVLASQGMVFAHSHHGMNLAESLEHAARPHVHVGGGGHHHHPHTDQHSHESASGHHDHHPSGHHENDDDDYGTTDLVPLASHDDDAVYGPDAFSISLSGQSNALRLTQAIAPHWCVWNAIVPEAPRLNAASGYCQPPPSSLSGGPLYLRTLSLRL